MYMCVCVCVCVYSNRSAPVACDTKSIFKRNLTGLDPEFSFSYISCQTEVKSQLYYLP